MINAPSGICMPIPGRAPLHLRHLLLDYNGTIAFDGQLVPDLLPIFQTLAPVLSMTVITADTFGSVRAAITEANLASIMNIHTLPHNQDEALAKRDFLRSLGASTCIAIGNGVNDALMLSEAALSIAIIGGEGCATISLQSSQLVVTDIRSALALLLNPRRCIATLRV